MKEKVPHTKLFSLPIAVSLFEEFPQILPLREEEKRILDEILGKSVYDNRIRPSGTNGTGW